MKKNTCEQQITAEKRCVIIGGADIGNYESVRGYLRDDDYAIYCDSGLKHREGLGMTPSLIIGDFDSFEDPHMDVETITLPVAKDDTDTMYAIKEGFRRGFRDYLLLGVTGARMDHSLVNLYALFWLDDHGCKALAVDDYSEISVISAQGNGGASAGASDDTSGRAYGGSAYVDDSYPYFSLLNMTGTARGITIRNAKFNVTDAEITSSYQYATSNEVLPGRTAEITIREGSLLLLKIIHA
ncbi:MAG: thiamine diphosphokinase [Mogibacterium sp.]|nr:thiamine diphosphokinase [Mogibacterium sp.]